MDYTSALKTVITFVETTTGAKVILENQSAVQPPYPFCTYSIPSPYLPKRTDYVGDQMGEVIEFVVSLTWHSKSNVEALSLASQTATSLKTLGGRQTLGDAGLTMVSIDGFTNRDTFITIDTERRYGFDVRFRTYASNIRPLEDITSVEVGTNTIT